MPVRESIVTEDPIEGLTDVGLTADAPAKVRRASHDARSGEGGASRGRHPSAQKVCRRGSFFGLSRRDPSCRAHSAIGLVSRDEKRLGAIVPGLDDLRRHRLKRRIWRPSSAADSIGLARHHRPAIAWALRRRIHSAAPISSRTIAAGAEPPESWTAGRT